MSLYENWLKGAYDSNGKAVNTFWNAYMPREQAIYEELIGNKINLIQSTVKQLGEKYDLQPQEICGFIDGINGGLKEEVNVEELEIDSNVKLDIDFAALYKKMVEYKAKHLYELPQWDNIFSEEERREMLTEQRKSKTVVKGDKIGRNDPCPCGSGKKYKLCCGNK